MSIKPFATESFILNSTGPSSVCSVNTATIRLVIIDPISSYLGKVDSHKNEAMKKLVEGGA